MDEEKYADILEEHRFTLVSKIKSEVFLDYMRCHQFLDQEDCETIRNNYIYQTRRQKAGAFIDILLTKGPDAFKVFVDLLQWEYPHVYQKIFNVRAKAPPPGYNRHSDGRLSQALHDFVNMGFRERDLMEQNDRLQNVLEYAQKELRDLERENLVLREKEMVVRQLEEKLDDSQTQVRNLKEENRGFMKKNIQLLEEIDGLNKKMQAIDKEHESLLKTVGVKDVEIQRMKESKDQLKESVEQARRESQRIVRLATLKDRSTRKVETSSSDKNRHVVAQLEILRCDLEAERTKNEELCQELSCVQNDLFTERRKIETLNNEMLKVQRDRDQHQLWLIHAERKIAQYFNNIQELEREKKKSEEEKIVLQTKSWDVLEQKQRLFAQKHEMERRFDKLQQNYEKLKLKFDFNQMQTIVYPVEQKRFAQYSPDTSLADPFLDKGTAEEGKSSIKSTSSCESLDINPDFEVFTLCLEVLEKDSPIQQWISSIRLDNTTSENAEPKSDVQVFGDAVTSLQSMFIRSKISWENRKLECSIPVKEGDILFVNEEIDEQMLRVTRVEPLSGHRMKAVGAIPNYKEARKFFHTPCYSEERVQCGLSRRAAIRRNEGIPYEIVLPLKATSCLPVLLCGNEAILLPLLDLLETRCQDWARVCTEPEAPEWKDMVDDKNHSIVSRCCTHSKDRDLYKFIIIGVKPLVSENYEESIEKIFGKELVDKYDLSQKKKDCVQEKETFYHKHGFHFDTLALNDPNISDTSSMLAIFKQKVDKVQDSIFWLNVHFK
ncbi:myosin-2 heavy chain-like isoform X2 [Gigantopelta aegis]|uniref:myosin-2 heavy chain-like isoform X2 n=1 Tax=Gigantopelta aegis TaxID=1735272 RepID=UPI001B88D99F|nr:myosin-2 heavy chain-like isoform X2 [Gigantopelta aegis]